MSNLAAPRILRVPRGKRDKPALELDMSIIDEGERRLHEVRMVSSATSQDLSGLYNESANTTSKYLAWVAYEILNADKQHMLDRATVMLDKAPEEAIRLKETGIKMNEDLREALIARDADCQISLDIVNSLKAVQKLLEASYWTFIRAHNAAGEVAKKKDFAPTPNFSGTVGQTYDLPQTNFMGKNERR